MPEIPFGTGSSTQRISPNSDVVYFGEKGSTPSDSDYQDGEVALWFDDSSPPVLMQRPHGGTASQVGSGGSGGSAAGERVCTTSDDIPTEAAALSANGGGTLKLTDGIHVIQSADQPYTPPENVTIEGQGDATIIEPSTDDDIIHLNGGRTPYLKDLTIDARNAGVNYTYPNAAISYRGDRSTRYQGGVSYVDHVNIVLPNDDGTGIRLYDGAANGIDWVQSEHINIFQGKVGIRVNNASNIGINANTFRNIFVAEAKFGYYATNDGNEVVGNDVELRMNGDPNLTEYGIRLVGEDGSVFRFQGFDHSGNINDGGPILIEEGTDNTFIPIGTTAMRRHMIDGGLRNRVENPNRSHLIHRHGGPLPEWLDHEGVGSISTTDGQSNLSTGSSSVGDSSRITHTPGSFTAWMVAQSVPRLEATIQPKATSGIFVRVGFVARGGVGDYNPSSPADQIMMVADPDNITGQGITSSWMHYSVDSGTESSTASNVSIADDAVSVGVQTSSYDPHATTGINGALVGNDSMSVDGSPVIEVRTTDGTNQDLWCKGSIDLGYTDQEFDDY